MNAHQKNMNKSLHRKLTTIMDGNAAKKRALATQRDFEIKEAMGASKSGVRFGADDMEIDHMVVPYLVKELGR